MPSVTPPIQWELRADFDDDGTYEADLTPYLKRLEYGIGRENARSSFGPRHLRATLGNQDSRFSPKKLTGPYGANLKRSRRCKLTATPGTQFGDRTNLVENPSLETNASGWVARNSATVVRDTTKAFYGRASAKITTANANQSGAFIRRVDGTTRMTIASPGASYVFRLMIAAPAGKSMQVSIRWFDGVGGGQEDSVAIVTGRGVDEWFLTTLANITAPAFAVTAELCVHTNGAQGVFDFWADGAYFHFGSGRNPYVDGDQPVCTWAGTAHASQSTRLQVDQQDIPQGVWRIRDISGVRSNMRGLVTLEGTTDEETWMDKLISCGPFTRQKAYNIAHRFVDLLQEGDIILDGAHRSTPTGGVTASATKTPEGETYVLIGTPNGFAYLDGGTGALDEYDSLEGDNLMNIVWFNDAIGDGWKIDVTGRTTVGSNWTFACFFGTDVLNAGKRLRLQLWDTNFGVTAETTVTLVANEYVYAVVSGGFTSGAVREVRVVAQDTPINSAQGLYWSGMNMVPTENRIARTIVGLDYDIELFPQGGFHRSAVAILEEFCRSACAFVYVDVDGGLTFEQTDTARSDTAVPKARLSDGRDGMPFLEPVDYKEGTTNIYNRVRVGSYGTVSHIGNFKRLWALEPGPLVLGANETRVLYADYMTEAGGMMLGRLADAKAVLTAGTLVADYPLLRGFGSSAEVVVKAGAGGATISELYVEARVQHRGSNEMVFYEHTSGAGPISEQKTLKLETPGQGSRTTPMVNLASWAVTKYVTGPALVGLSIPAGPVGATDDAALEGWQRVMEIIGRDAGLPLWAKHKNGEGALYLDELYYVEGRTVTAEVKEGKGIGTPKVALKLEEA